MQQPPADASAYHHAGVASDASEHALAHARHQLLNAFNGLRLSVDALWAAEGADEAVEWLDTLIRSAEKGERAIDALLVSLDPQA